MKRRGRENIVCSVCGGGWVVVLGGGGAAESESINVTLKCSAVPLMHDLHFTHSKSDSVPQVCYKS